MCSKCSDRRLRFFRCWRLRSFLSSSRSRSFGRHCYRRLFGSLGLACSGILGWRNRFYGNYCRGFCRRGLLRVCLLCWLFLRAVFRYYNRRGRAFCLSSSGRCCFTGAVLVFTAGLRVPLGAAVPALRRADQPLELNQLWGQQLCLRRRSRRCLSAGLLVAAGCFLRCRLFCAACFAGGSRSRSWCGLGWPLAPEFCAVATVAMAVASARICISFISIPFCALFILKLFTASPSATELVDPPSAAPEPAALPVHG